MLVLILIVKLNYGKYDYSYFSLTHSFFLQKKEIKNDNKKVIRERYRERTDEANQYRH